MATSGYPAPQLGYGPTPIPPPGPAPSFSIYPPHTSPSGYGGPPPPHPQGPSASYLPGVPPGLEELAQTNLVLIRQQVELVEDPQPCWFETRNRYTVQSGEGRPLFQAMEKSHLCARLCCGTRRSLHLELADRAGRPCLLLCRPLRCAACFCPCCLQELEVQCPPGTTLGHVVQTWHPMIPKFSVLTADRDPVLRIVGPCLACACGGDVHFEVKTTDESRGVGRISKQWGGLLQEALTDVDTFGVQFPLDLDVKVKATLLGACFLIDLMFFEKTAAGPQPSSVLSP